MNVKDLPCAVKAVGKDDGLGDGEYRAIVSAFGNADVVGDVVMPGAFKDTLNAWSEKGDPIPLVWSHDWSDPFSHIGEVLAAKETDAGLEVHAKLDLDNPTAKQVYKLLKGRRVNNHSFAYDVLDATPAEHDGKDVVELRKLSLIECGPCLMGANTETPVLDIKSAVGAHSTATSDKEWDGPKNEARLSNDAGESTYKKAYAWQDPDGDADKKAAWKFIHHEIAEDGSVGAANIQACTTGIGALNGGRGGSNVPDADRKGVYNHLAKHIRDSGGEPAELKAQPTDDSAEWVSIPAEAWQAIKTAYEAVAQTSEHGSDTSSTTGGVQETGQPDSAAANEPTASGSSAEQPQGSRSAQVAARIKAIHHRAKG